MNPPLRTEEDVAALLEGLADGTVDCIATDHAPHNPNEKALEFDRAPFGILGLETALGLAITKLVHPGHISLKRLIELFSANPARIIHKPFGELKAGSIADITLFDPDKEWTFDIQQTRSKSRNSPFHGMSLKGCVVATLVGGRIVYRNPSWVK